MHEDEPRVQVGGFAEEFGGGVDREDRLFDLGVAGELKPVVGRVIGPAVEFEDLVEEADNVIPGCCFHAESPFACVGTGGSGSASAVPSGIFL